MFGVSKIHVRLPPLAAQLDGGDSECYKRGTGIVRSASPTVRMLRLHGVDPIFRS
jgi:hypothetical protein